MSTTVTLVIFVKLQLQLAQGVRRRPTQRASRQDKRTIKSRVDPLLTQAAKQAGA